MPRRVEPPSLLLHELLDWIAARPRSYDDAIEAWRSNCPRDPVLDDAFTAGLIAVTNKSVVLTEAGRHTRSHPPWLVDCAVDRSDQG